MKLLTVNLARSILLGHFLDFNPRGIRLDNILFPFLLDTYKFRKFPSPTENEDLSNGLIFSDGEFVIDNGVPISVNLTIYNDGIVVDTRSSTSHSDLFLEDASTQLSEIYKSPPFYSIFKEKLYLSQLFISTNKSLENINPKLVEISKYLSQNMGKDVYFQTGGISFWSDQKEKIPPLAFTFERALNVPFPENRYYSQAPLTTEKHLELLDKLESVLS